MKYFANPLVAIGFGAFMLCAETCLHAEDLLAAGASSFALPFYDWTAGGFLLTAGVLSHRAWTITRRQYQAVAWAFMLSLLLGALFSQTEEWLTPPNVEEWGISEGALLGMIVVLVIVALCGLISSLKEAEPSRTT